MAGNAPSPNRLSENNKMLIDDTSSPCGDGQKTHTHSQGFALHGLVLQIERSAVFQEICRVTAHLKPCAPWNCSTAWSVSSTLPAWNGA